MQLRHLEKGRAIVIANPATHNDPARAAAKRMRCINAQPIEAAAQPDALLTMRTINAITGLSPATIYRRMAAHDFPEALRLSARCTRWRSADVRSWLAAQGTTK